MTVSTKTQDKIVIQVEIEAPPESVFRALTTPDQLTDWWGDDSVYRSDSWIVDLRVGGRYLSQGKNADGRPFEVSGEYLEIDPPRRLSFSWKPSWEEMGPATVVVFDLKPVETGTRLTMTHGGFAGYPEAFKNHSQGWPLVLGWLKNFGERRG
ncbi:MAG: SRPBCC domain-containing protein [Acidobacteriota bacterium]